MCGNYFICFIEKFIVFKKYIAQFPDVRVDFRAEIPTLFDKMTQSNLIEFFN